jgi:Ser-tRNA(Ala) deacylase AlaX
VYRSAAAHTGTVSFVGYEEDEADTRVAALVAPGGLLEAIEEGSEIEVVLARTPFYPEGGGQLGDHGLITTDTGRLQVVDTVSPLEGLIVHRARVEAGEVRAGQDAHAGIDRARRASITRGHTATHILHATVRELLGEHAAQAGSAIDAGRFRFDFPHFEAVPRDRLAEIEETVNRRIAEDPPIEVLETTQEEARAIGAIALFGEKYGDRVRVVRIADYSSELCGGTHVGHTGEVALFTILHEGSIAANLRRIEAVTGPEAFAFLAKERLVAEQLSQLLKVPTDEVVERVSGLLARLREAEKAVARARTDALLASDVPEDPYLGGELEAYFPAPLRKPYRKQMQEHRLRREIISTHVTNSIVHRMGPTFAHRVQEESGADASSVARAYAIAREVFTVRTLWKATEELDNQVPSSVQIAVMVQTQRLIKHATHWLLARRGTLDIARSVKRFGPGIADLGKAFPGVLAEGDAHLFDERCEKYVGFGFPTRVARRIAALNVLYPALDLVEIATKARIPIADTAAAYFRLGHELGLGWMRDQIESLTVSGHWHAIARATLRDELYAQQRTLTSQILAGDKDMDADARLDAWLERVAPSVQHIARLIGDMKTAGSHDFATLSVALGEVRKLAQLKA